MSTLQDPMAFMQPVAEFITVYHVETNDGTVYVPADVCGDLNLDAALDDATGWSVATVKALAPYLDAGAIILAIEERTGWYGRLSADGHLDCTSWTGPYSMAREALAAVKEQYECDDEGDLDDGGDDIDGYDDTRTEGH